MDIIDDNGWKRRNDTDFCGAFVAGFPRTNLTREVQESFRELFGNPADPNANYLRTASNNARMPRTDLPNIDFGHFVGFLEGKMRTLNLLV